MKLKRLLAWVLGTLMALSLAGCSGGKDTAGTTGGGTAAVDTTAGGNEAGDEISTIKISYPCLVVTPTEEGTAEAENAINKYLEEIGEKVRIDLDPIDGNNYSTQVDMQIIGGENIDIYCPLTGMDAAVQTNKLLALDDYLNDELAGAIEVMGEDFKKNCEFNGKTYALPCYKGSVLVY